MDKFKVCENVWIGSHNSLSYMRPRQWWLRPLAWTARCQSMDLIQQWNAGVRFFDIRAKYRDGCWISGHGMMDYNVEITYAIGWLEWTANDQDEKCVVRVMLEDSGGVHSDTAFANLVYEWQCMFPHITFVGGYRKNPFEVIAKVESVPELHCYQFFQDYGAKTWWQKLKGLRFPWPRYWAKKKNAGYWQGVNGEVYTIMDFVEIR